jgi:hypothetical protein
MSRCRHLPFLAAATSTQRTVNGTSAGTETTTGANDQGSFTAVRVMGDTTKNCTLPLPRGRLSCE